MTTLPPLLATSASSAQGAGGWGSVGREQAGRGPAGVGVADRSAAPTGRAEEAAGAASSQLKDAAGKPLSQEDARKVKELEARDAEVRRHEQAHKAAGGQFARGAPTYEMTRGPDGRSYATGGEVKIDTGEVPNDPEATIRKMQQVRRAALAPESPSAQDRRVAAEASRKEQKARAELRELERAAESYAGQAAEPQKSMLDALG